MLETKLTFILCGTQKGGTTALDTYLREHPQIGMANQKELHFFDNPANFENNVDYSFLHQSYKPKVGNRVFGECTPSYLYFPDVPQRLHDYNPDLKLIVLLRNPVERAYSHWQMEFNRGYETLSFSEAIRSESTRLAQAGDAEKRVYSYIDRGHYWRQLQQMWQFFPTENVFILKSEDLKTMPTSCLNQVCEFLGVDPFMYVQEKDVHSQNYDEPLPESDREYLIAQFMEDITALENSLGWDLSTWKN